MKRFGTLYGGFFYPENLEGLDRNSIVYCIGAGEDISHDIVLGNQLGCDLYIMDPTPRALEHCELVKNVFEGKMRPFYNKKIGGGDPFTYWKLLLENKISSDKINIINCAVGIHKGQQKFYMPSNEEYISCSLEIGMKGEKYITVDVKTLKNVMHTNNHTHIDLLKMDIEGTECDVIDDMLEEGIYPKYLAVEFDLAFHGENIRDVERCNKTIEKLYENKYELIYQNESDFTFKLKKSIHQRI